MDYTLFRTAIAIDRVVRGALTGNPFDCALQAELTRLYAAAGEPAPLILGVLDTLLEDDGADQLTDVGLTYRQVDRALRLDGGGNRYDSGLPAADEIPWEE